MKTQNLENVLINRLIFQYILECQLQIYADPNTDPAYRFEADPDPDPAVQFVADPDPQHCSAGRIGWQRTVPTDSV
jgi:hypothetical protein